MQGEGASYLDPSFSIYEGASLLAMAPVCQAQSSHLVALWATYDSVTLVQSFCPGLCRLSGAPGAGPALREHQHLGHGCGSSVSGPVVFSQARRLQLPDQEGPQEGGPEGSLR